MIGYILFAICMSIAAGLYFFGHYDMSTYWLGLAIVFQNIQAAEERNRD